MWELLYDSLSQTPQNQVNHDESSLFGYQSCHLAGNQLMKHRQFDRFNRALLRFSLDAWLRQIVGAGFSQFAVGWGKKSVMKDWFYSCLKPSNP